MAIFISLRCEERGEGRDGENRCWSDDNNDPWTMADDTKKSANACLSQLFDEVKEAGWRKINGGWVCPACQKLMQGDIPNAAE